MRSVHRCVLAGVSQTPFKVSADVESSLHPGL